MSRVEPALFGLSDSDYRKVAAVLISHHCVEKAIIYGSRARATHKTGSDIDLTLIGNCPYREFQQIESELDELLLPYQFDLSLHTHIDNPALLKHIEQEGKTFYKR